MADNIFDNSALGTQRTIVAGTGALDFSNTASDNSFSLGPGDTNDYYKLTVSRSSNLVIKLSPQGGNLNVSLLDYTGDPNNTIAPSTNNPSSLAQAIVTDPTAPLVPGQTYFIRVYANNPTTTINYDLTVESAPTTRADILWRNYSPAGTPDSGVNGIWQMDGLQITGIVGVGYSVDPSWQLAAVGDFNGDGNPDYLWHNANGTNGIWLMDRTGTSIESLVALPVLGGSDWRVVGVGDFNNDSNLDILWQNNADSVCGVWIMNRTSYVSAVIIDSLQSPGWSAQTVADFNGDNKPDVVYRNSLTGANVIWIMNGAKFQSQVTLPSIDPSWAIKGTGDFNGDNNLDLVLRSSTGEDQVWFMNGTTFLSSTAFTSADPIYDIAGILTNPMPVDLAGNSTSSAFNIGVLDAAATYSDTIGPADIEEYYAFSLKNKSKISVTANGLGLAPTTAIEILSADGVVVGNTLANGGNEQKVTDLQLDTGTYYVHLKSTATNAINYTITFEAAAQLPVNLFFPTAPTPIVLKKLDGTIITTSSAVSVKDPYPFNLTYNVTYTGSPLNSFKVAFFLSTDPTITTSDYRFDVNGDGQRNTNDFVAITGTQPDTIISRTQQLTLPSKDDPFWVQDGIYYIGVILDPENEIPEANLQNVPKEDDNTASAQIRVRDARLPDLTTASFTSPSSATKPTNINPTQISLSGVISNIGTASSDTQNPVGSPFGVSFYLSKDNQFSPGSDFSLGSLELSALAAGAQENFAQTVTLPTNWAGYQQTPLDNNYYLITVIDPDQTVNEITGGVANNITSRLITIA